MVEYLHAVRPARAYATHDGMLNEYGLGVVDGWLAIEAGREQADIRRLAVGESVILG